MQPTPELPRFAVCQTQATMIYGFQCYDCDEGMKLDARPFHPPKAPACPSCRKEMDRVFGCRIDTSGCQDHSFIPEQSRVVESDRDYNQTRGIRKEKQFDAAIKRRRADLADGGNRGSFRHTHSFPAEFYHGKIRETGDPDYFKDPKNLARHQNMRVDNG